MGTPSGPSSTLSEPSTPYEPGPTERILGRTEPRLYTPPLVVGAPGPCGCGCALTPETSYGFGADDFAREILEQPLDPWERWLVIHAGELLPDGRPRFRKVLVIVARQNGKTHVLVVLSLYWLFVLQVGLVLGTSTNLDYARESWEKAVELVESIEVLDEDVPKGGVRRANGEQTLTVLSYADGKRRRCRYKIAASNRKGGRSLTVNRLILDELREHDSWDPWNASYNAMNAVADAQAFGISNKGDARAIVLNALRREAIEVDEVTGRETLRPDSDPEMGWFEWSAPQGSEPDDPHALAMANPNLGRRVGLGSLLADARRVKREGGEALAKFLTEILCMDVPNLNPALSREGWEKGKDPASMDGLRDRLALVLDVSIDEQHATLVTAAVLPDGRRVRVEPVKAWSGPLAMQQLRAELRPWVRQIKPRRFGWFPSGPAAAVAAEMAVGAQRDGEQWPPPGVEVEEIRKDLPAVCMGFASLVKDGDVLNSGDPLLDAQVGGAEKLQRGEGWVFTRRGAGHVDSVYGAAGATHMARTMPPEEKPPPRPMVV
ncbi:terminase [Amycolatopsis sp. YIM 10]|uniref:terminase n=1 Tax=Amycolatopsis sp. YIM 10 TaxID=2653857 RepID=UPI001D1381AB|nr:terminase [Amycolatopsis sp. YIM 10]